jgi:ribose-phosphate pyrophosphokinase
VGRARVFAKRLDAPLAIIDKRRPAPNVAEVLHVIGDVAGRNVVIFDDMVDTAGTLTESARALSEQKSKRIFSAATHAVLSGPAVDRIAQSNLEKIFVTNTIPLTDKAAASGRFTVLSVAELFGEAIRRINEGSSVSSLFA